MEHVNLYEIPISLKGEKSKMRHPDTGKYIMFLDRTIGSDGKKYIQNVKYKLQKETPEALYLAGKKNWLNKFVKSSLGDRYVEGNIIAD